MTDSATLWERLLEAIAWKNGKKRENPLVIFNTLAKEFVPGVRKLDSESCRIRQEPWKSEQLRTLTTRCPECTTNFEKEPIILFRHQGSNYVIDGNRRLNLWNLKNDQYDHEVIIVELNDRN